MKTKRDEKELITIIILQLPDVKLSKQIIASKHPTSLPMLTKKFKKTNPFPLYWIGMISLSIEVVRGREKP